MYAVDQTNCIKHRGIIGMKWGVRRYQNPDGSLTSAGMEKYGSRNFSTRKAVKKAYGKMLTGMLLSAMGGVTMFGLTAGTMIGASGKKIQLPVKKSDPKRFKAVCDKIIKAFGDVKISGKNAMANSKETLRKFAEHRKYLPYGRYFPYKWYYTYVKPPKII